MSESNSLLNHPLLQQNDGAIFLDNERILLTSSSVFGTLRKELIENIGMERVKGFLLRYGWNLGANDAKKVLEKNLPTLEDFLKQGPALHMIKGYTKVKTMKLHYELDGNQTIQSVHVEGEWYNSYEAEEHERQFGIAKFPICHTLIGYASGYYSMICGHTVIFKELSCKGTGEPKCSYVGKSIHSWNGEADEEWKYYENTTIVAELERTYEALLQERNNLSKASEMNKKLTQELINGSDLQSIAEVVYKTTKIPLLIEDVHFRDYAYAGLSAELLKAVQQDFGCWLENQKYSNKDFVSYSSTRRIQAEQHDRLMTPIRLQKKMSGYCSFIYQEEMEHFPAVDYMILEKISSVTSLYLLNEKTSFESMERMKGHFLEQVLGGQFSSKKEILKRGRYISIDFELPFYIVILKHQYTEKYVEKELVFHEEMMETTLQYFHKKSSNVIIGQRAADTVLFVQTGKSNEDIGPLCNQFMNHLSAKYKGASFMIGISTIGEDITKAPEYYQEALSALEMADSYKKIVSFDELGLVGMLIHSKDDKAILQKAKHLVSPLTKNRALKDAELMKTLYVFLQNGGNLERTMEELSLSKSGLRYRLQKIESCLGQDIRDPEVSYQLRLTLQVLLLKREIKLN